VKWWGVVWRNIASSGRAAAWQKRHIFGWREKAYQWQNIPLSFKLLDNLALGVISDNASVCVAAKIEDF